MKIKEEVVKVNNFDDAQVKHTTFLKMTSHFFVNLDETFKIAKKIMKESEFPIIRIVIDLRNEGIEYTQVTPLDKEPKEVEFE
jgi:hypothetical protein